MEGKYLIIGGGLSGLLLANALTKKGKIVRVMDDGNNHSTIVAAGLVNPISFRRTLLSWNAALFYPFAKNFYEDIQKGSDEEIIKPLTLRRIFSSLEESKTWQSRLIAPDFIPFILPMIEKDRTFGLFGSGRVIGFCVDGKALLKKLKKNQEVILQLFNPAELDPRRGLYQGEHYEKIIFCCGYRNTENPFFNHLPVKATKGQLLLVKWSNNDEDTSLHRKCFAIPKGNNRFLLGSTFEWGNVDLEKTDEARNKILEDFKSISSDNAIVMDHTVGIRPTTPDRRPIIGPHPEFSNLYIFNGLGTKGYLTAPYLAEHLAKHLLANEPLDPLVSLNRFEWRENFV